MDLCHFAARAIDCDDGGAPTALVPPSRLSPRPRLLLTFPPPSRPRPRTTQTKLQAGAVAPEAQVKLQVLASQCAAYDFRAAQKTQTEMASIDWNASKEWQKGVRNLVTLALVKSGGSR